MSKMMAYKRGDMWSTSAGVLNGQAGSFTRGKLASLILSIVAFVLLTQSLYVVIDAAESPAMKANLRNLTVDKGTNFTIDLQCAAGRGFSWQLTEMVPTNKVALLKERFTTESDKDGADGIQHFDFKASAAGTTSLSFIYVQPFRKPFPKDAKTTNIVVTIK